MYPDMTITITRRPDAYFVMIPLTISVMLVVGMVLEQLGLPHHGRPLQSILAMLFFFGSMFTVGVVTAVLPQGKLEIHGNQMRATMRLRRTRVFDLGETTVGLEQWIGPGSVRSGPMGPMLVFDQGQTHFRIGCYDYDVALLLVPVRTGEWLTREPHGTTKCVDFYALAELLGVHVPKPVGWRLQEVL